MTATQSQTAFPKIYDSATWEDIPPGSDAALYFDGEWPAPKTAADNRRARWITVEWDYRNCSIVDLFEQPWWSPARLRAFVRGRRAMGMYAIVYTDQAAAAEQWAALRDDDHGELLDYERLLWWVATRNFGQPTAIELATDLAIRWSAPIPPDRIWANQYTLNPQNNYDVSNRYLPW
jgi:hypothetical protein